MKTVLIFLLSAFCASAAVEFTSTSGQCLHLAGENRLALGFTNEITISFWLVKRAGLASGSEYVGKGRVLNGTIQHFTIRDSGGKFEFIFANPNNTFRQFAQTTATGQTNVPMHVAFRFRWGTTNANAAGGPQFFINGLPVDGQWNANMSKVAGLSNAEPFRIGSTYAGSTMQGYIGEVAVWNAYLEFDEIAVLGKSFIAGKPLEIRRNPDKLATYHPLAFDFVPFITISGSNTIRDLGPNRFDMTPLSSPLSQPAWLSQP